MDLDQLPQIPDDVALPIVLGIDPGTRVVGYGAVVVRREGPRLLAAGALRTSSTDVPTRLGAIRQGVDLLLARLRPSLVVVEQAYTARNPQSALRIGEGRGVILSAAACAGARIEQLQASSAKKVLVGTGSADKARVAQMVAHELRLDDPPKPLDATDALALAIAAVHRDKVTARLGAHGARGGATPGRGASERSGGVG